MKPNKAKVRVAQRHEKKYRKFIKSPNDETDTLVLGNSSGPFCSTNEVSLVELSSLLEETETLSTSGPNTNLIAKLKSIKLPPNPLYIN